MKSDIQIQDKILAERLDPKIKASNIGAEVSDRNVTLSGYAVTDSEKNNAEKAVRLIDVNDHNIFDIDAYGSPYEILDYIIDKIDTSNKKIAFVITDGIDMDLRLGRVCTGLRNFIGYDFHIAKRAHVLHDDFIKIVIDKIKDKLNGSICSFLIAQGTKGSSMRYYSFVVNRDAV